MLQQKIEVKKSSFRCRNDGRLCNEEKKITSQFGNDPIAKLRARELDLQAQENARKEKEGEEKIKSRQDESYDESTELKMRN